MEAKLTQSLGRRSRLYLRVRTTISRKWKKRKGVDRIPPTNKEKLVKTSDGQHSDGIAGFQR
jgi:hypothetical protein